MPESHDFAIGKIRLGANAPLFLIAGPCVIESEAHAMDLAERLAAVASELVRPLIFKASYDKANRSSLSSYRGPALEEGLRILAAINKRTGLPILTDVHEISHAWPQPPKSATSCKFPHSSRARPTSCSPPDCRAES